MKIVLFGENVSVHIQKWIRGLMVHSEIELHVITFDRGAQFDGVQYHYIKRYTKTKFDYILNVFRVRTFIKEIKPDLIHAHHSTSHGFLAAFSGFHPLIITGWGSDILDSPKNPLLKALLKYSLNKANAITVLSFFTKREIAKLTDKYVHVVPFGVDLEKFPAKAVDTNKQHIVIGTIRTLTEKYGVEYLIRAFAVVSAKHDNLKLEIVGDGPLREYLQNLSLELGLGDKVVFHGYINQNTEQSKYISLLSSFDVFTILSTMDSDTFGVAAVEALACEIPVVATSVGGLSEVVDSEKAGIIVSPRDVEGTAIALERLIVSKDLREQMGKYGRQKVLAHYNWPENVKQMVSLYRNTIKELQ